jgi:hypothetical protein
MNNSKKKKFNGRKSHRKNLDCSLLQNMGYNDNNNVGYVSSRGWLVCLFFIFIFFLPKFAQGRNNKHITLADLSLSLFVIFLPQFTFKCEDFFLTPTHLSRLFSHPIYFQLLMKEVITKFQLKFYLFIYNVPKNNNN